MSNPLDDYLMEKEAAPRPRGDMMQRVGDAALSFGVGSALMAAPAVGQKIMNAVTKRRDYNNMMDQNPELADAKAESPQQFNNFYNSLHRQNPTFAKDPVISGTYMNQMMAHPVGAGKVIVESMGAAGKAPRSGMPSLGDAWTSGARAGAGALTG